MSRNKDEEIKYRARHLLHLLDENTKNYEVVIVTNEILDIIDDYGLENSPDNQICACATTIKDCIFITNDLACKTIAKWIFKLDVSSVIENGDGLVSVITDGLYVKRKLRISFLSISSFLLFIDLCG